jgi:hypothetical protein
MEILLESAIPITFLTLNHIPTMVVRANDVISWDKMHISRMHHRDLHIFGEEPSRLLADAL